MEARVSQKDKVVMEKKEENGKMMEGYVMCIPSNPLVKGFNM